MATKTQERLRTKLMAELPPVLVQKAQDAHPEKAPLHDAQKEAIELGCGEWLDLLGDDFDDDDE